MAFQRSLNRLQGSPHWRSLEAFAADASRVELTFSTKVTSANREDIRQICRYLSLNFRCDGDGSQKRIKALKLDIIRERVRAEELAKAAPGAVASFYRGALDLFPPEQRAKINALFVKHYGGEHAWSLGEKDVGGPARPPAHAEQGPGPGGPPAKRRRTGDTESSSSDDDSEDIQALLNRWKTVSSDGLMG
mmetsp:Transcript_50998/g.143562  ORF Transcript_50998/g.143562 Transcript_50998/m.143562 type:complete len:191 (-) Transcript_50998:178-750(-)